jgi:hypothetical protein
MISRHLNKRKYIPGLDALESKQLLSAGVTTQALGSLAQPGPNGSPVAVQVSMIPCGTGSSNRVISSASTKLIT